jgi:murein DD-endopeptidase MepM/ murein hydrolase activator NlpD
MQIIDFSTLSKSSLRIMFPTVAFERIVAPNMSINGGFFGGDVQHEDLGAAAQRLDAFQQEHPNALLANGYLEERAFYNTSNYERQGPNGTEFRNIHLGTDFWLPAQTPVHAPFDGTVVVSHLNDYHKDYGPLLVLKHEIKSEEVAGLKSEDDTFYTLYGHLTKDSLTLSPKGKTVKKGDLLGKIGNEQENGHWLPHLHFQVVTDLLGQTQNFNGTAYPSELEYWKTICPNPNHLFVESF